MRAEKGQINVWRKKKSKETKADVTAGTVMREKTNHHVDQGSANNQYLCKELLKHPTFKCDLVGVLARFDYCVLSKLPRSQARESSSRQF